MNLIFKKGEYRIEIFTLSYLDQACELIINSFRTCIDN
jgi:hypothetical protein